MELIFGLIIAGIIIGFIPVVLFFEIYHLIMKKDKVSHPYIKGLISSAIVGTLLIFWTREESRGEPLAMVIQSIIITGIILSGLIIAFFYGRRKRPLLPSGILNRILNFFR